MDGYFFMSKGVDWGSGGEISDEAFIKIREYFEKVVGNSEYIIGNR